MNGEMSEAEQVERMVARAKECGISRSELEQMLAKASELKVPYCDRAFEWFVGREVKVAFEGTDPRPEYMWVEVKAAEGSKLVGALLHDPLRVTHVRRGDQVEVDRGQVEGDYVSRAEWVAGQE